MNAPECPCGRSCDWDQRQCFRCLSAERERENQVEADLYAMHARAIRPQHGITLEEIAACDLPGMTMSREDFERAEAGDIETWECFSLQDMRDCCEVVMAQRRAMHRRAA